MKRFGHRSHSASSRWTRIKGLKDKLEKQVDAMNRKYAKNKETTNAQLRRQNDALGSNSSAEEGRSVLRPNKRHSRILSPETGRNGSGGNKKSGRLSEGLHRVSSGSDSSAPRASVDQRQDVEVSNVPLSLKSHSTTYADRETWLQGRSQGIGASDAPIILGESDWDSAYSLWAKKRGMVPFDPTESLAMEIGRFMEACAASIYERITRREVFDLGAFTVQRHPVFRCLTCTLDRVVHDHAKGWGCLNLKAVGGAKADEWTEGPPRVYWVQEQMEMFVCGLSWASLGVIVSNYDFRWCDVDRDDEFIDTVLVPRLLRFWAHVQCGIPPSADGHAATSKALSKLHPLEDGSTVVLPAEFDELDADLLQVKQDLDQLTFRKSEMENRIKSAIGEATYGLIPGRARYSWKVQGTQSGYARVLRRKSA